MCAFDALENLKATTSEVMAARHPSGSFESRRRLRNEREMREASMAEVVRTDQLTKRYGKTTALASLDLTIEAGEVFGYLGPNGAGKSTTIALLLGLIRPTSGTATIFGLDVWREARAVHRR